MSLRDVTFIYDTTFASRDQDSFAWGMPSRLVPFVIGSGRFWNFLDSADSDVSARAALYSYTDFAIAR